MHSEVNWPPISSAANGKMYGAVGVEVKAVILAMLVTWQSTFLFDILIIYL